MIMMIGAALAALVSMALCTFAYLNWRRATKYERAVKKWLGKDEYCYVERVMWDFYKIGRSPFDAAQEMKAMHYED